MKILKLFYLGILFFLIYSCTNESIPSSEVCFQQDVFPIILSSCTYSGCHNGSTTELSDYTTYEGILSEVEPGNHRKSKLYTSMIALDPMPPSPYDRMSEDKLLIIASWIDQGAKNDLCQVQNCDTTNFTLSGSVKPILDKYCGGCHSIKNPQGNVDFRTYTSLKRYVDDGSLIGSINFDQAYSNMPKNGNKIPTCDITIITKWVNAGALNN